jgi:hypothetical protein
LRNFDPQALRLTLQLNRTQHAYAKLEQEPLWGELILKNAGRQPLPVLDGPVAKGLLGLTIYRVGPGGKQPLNLQQKPGAQNLNDFRGQNRIVELLPERSLHIPFALSQRFLFTEPGRYEIQLCYQPYVFTKENKLDASRTVVRSRAMNKSTKYDLRFAVHPTKSPR